MQKRYRKWLWLVLALLVVLGGIGGLVHQRLASTSHKTVKVGLVEPTHCRFGRTWPAG